MLLPLPVIMGLLFDEPNDVITIGLSCDPEPVILKWPVNVSPFLKRCCLLQKIQYLKF